MVSVKEEQKLISYVDYFIVLGRELDKTKIDYFMSLFLATNEDLRKHKKIILSEKKGFFNSKIAEESKLKKTRDYLVKKGLSKENIFLETKSVDTITSLYYSKKIIENDYDKLIKPVVGILLNNYSLKRTKWLSNKIFGNSMYSLLFPVEELNTRPCIEFKENILLSAIKHDMKNISNGYNIHLENYFKTKHPYTAETPSPSRYGKLVNIVKKLSN